MGASGQGKSTLGNILIAQEDVFETSDEAWSCTKSAKCRTTTVGDQTYKIVDTMGVFDTDEAEEVCCDKIMRQVAAESTSGVDAFLLVMRKDKFTQQKRDQFEALKNVLGREFAKYAVMVFTHADDIDVSRPEHLVQVLGEMDGGHVCSNKDRPEQSRSRVFDAITALVEKKGGAYAPEQLKEAQAKVESLRQIKADVESKEIADKIIRAFSCGSQSLEEAAAELKELRTRERKEKETFRLAAEKAREEAEKREQTAKEETRRAREAKDEMERALAKAENKANEEEKRAAVARKEMQDAVAELKARSEMQSRVASGVAGGVAGGAAVGAASEAVAIKAGVLTAMSVVPVLLCALTGAAVAGSLAARPKQ